MSQNVMCKHKIEKNKCSRCDSKGHIANLVRNRINRSVKDDKELSSKKYIVVILRS